MPHPSGLLKTELPEKCRNETKVANIALSDIKVDPACQARVTTNATTIAEYAEIMTEEGNVFPAVVIYYDGTDHWLSDGFHRHAAAQTAGLGSLKAEIREGTRRDAILYAVGANATLRRTREDKRHAVDILLTDEEWRKWSNRTIAHRCGVDEKLVRTLRSASAAKPQIARTVMRNGTPYSMKTDNIGKRDGLDELLSIEPDRDVQPDQPWIVQPDTGTAKEDTGEDIADDERGPVCDPASGTEEGQLQDLLSAWSRASEEVQQQFLAAIAISVRHQVEADPAFIEPEPVEEPKPHQADPPKEQEVSHEPDAPVTEPQDDPLFRIWMDLKPNTRACAQYWVEHGELHPHEHWTSSHSLVPFRAAGIEATPQQRAAFLELARTYEAENPYS